MAAEATEKDCLRKYLNDGVKYFEKSTKEEVCSSRSSFCYPFYRSYLAIIIGSENESEVQRYLTEASDAVGDSSAKRELLKAVENLARALKKSHELKDRPIHEIAAELSAYSWYCERAAEHMNAVEGSAPVAIRLMRKANPILDERMQTIISDIQEAARQICRLTRDKGRTAEAFCVQINDAAKSLSDEDFVKVFNSVSDIIIILKSKTELLSINERVQIDAQLEEIDRTRELPLKLVGIRHAINFFISNIGTDNEFIRRLIQMDEKLDRMHVETKIFRQILLDRFEFNEQRILSSVFERLDEDKLEIIKILIDAVEGKKVSKDLIAETLDGMKEMISEMREMRIEIKDVTRGISISSLDEIIDSPELSIENKLKVTIPIIPLLLTYEGTYNFKNSMKLDAAWTKLNKLFPSQA